MATTAPEQQQPQPNDGVTLESVAEEVLNGLFCHYEPPTSQSAQRKAAEEATKFPYKYGYVGRKKSILRPSRLVRKQKAQTVRSVTWRDEQKKSDAIESKITSCAMDQCNLFGNSTGDGIADTLAPPPSVPVKLASSLKKKSVGPLKSDSTGAPKKVLYDDEGNPIDDDEDDFQDENAPPSQENRSRSTKNSYYYSPFGRPADEMPLSEAQLNSGNPSMYEDMYEPENYDRPSSKAIAYRRMRSPPIRNPTPRYPREEEDDLETEEEFLERVGRVPPRRRSNSPSRPRHPDDGYYEGGSPRRSPRGMGWISKLRRPGTPYRRRRSKEGDAEYDSEEDIQRLGRSSSRERGRPRQRRDYDDYEDDNTGDYDYERRGRDDDDALPRHVPRRSSRSPTRRSDVYSDLTEDVPRDRYDTPPRRRSRSPRRPDNYPTDEEEIPAGLSQQPTRDYDRRDYAGGEYDDYDREDSRRRRSDYYDHEAPPPMGYRDYDDRRYYDDGYYRRSSREFDDAYDRRRSSRDGRRSSSMSPRSRRKWGFGFSKSNPEDGADGRASPTPITLLSPEEEEYEYQRRYDEKLRRARRESDPIPSRRSHRRDMYTDDRDQDSYERRRPHTTTSAQSRRGPLPLDTSQDEEMSDSRARRNRDPTPRMSSEGLDAAAKPSKELPPTPRVPGRDSKLSPAELEQTLARPGRPYRHELPEHQRIDTTEETMAEREARTRKVLEKQLSPTSMATDDEIREEVSSVGMESNTIRPLNYPNPFLQVPPPILEDSGTNAGSDHEPSTLSSALKSKESTLSSPHLTTTYEQRKRANADIAIQPASTESTSKSTKKYWKGWRKAVGKVKNIVQEIDEKRIPPPYIPGVDLKGGRRSRKTE